MPYIDGTARAVLSTAAFLLFAPVLVACGSGTDEAAAGAGTAAAAGAAEAASFEPREPIGPATSLPPNELGRVMVLEYHRLGEPEGEWYRSLSNFRADLERLYEAGYRPVTVRQLAAGDIDVPRGTTPVAFTFDDSSLGQFYLLEDGSVDPNTMFGIWEAFRREHPEWEHGGTWCILPGADYPSNFFGERPRGEVPREQREATIQRKMDLLLAGGHEICNHTLYHARLDRARDDAQVQEWIGRGADSLRVYLPEDYRITTFALPLGLWPENRALAWQGAHAGSEYRHDVVLEVTGGPSVSPFDATFDPLSVDRVIVAPGHLERYLSGFEANPERRFVSDGDPRVITVPASLAPQVDLGRWPDHELRVIDDALPPPAEAASPRETSAPPPAATASGERQAGG